MIPSAHIELTSGPCGERLRVAAGVSGELHSADTCVRIHQPHIWYNREGRPADSMENIVVLSEEFFAEAQAHPIPADLEAVRVLASAPAVLDLFLWLTYRCSPRRVKRRSRCSVHAA